MAGDVEVLYEDGEVVVTAALSTRRRVKMVSFKAPPELVERVDSLSRALGVTRSELIREALELYVKLRGPRVGEEGVH